ncbi:MAG: disulfide bond formation protein B [Planctomycetes bacterium]|nr:disulfide bond formation protein B [Planctomycetota bacterium]
MTRDIRYTILAVAVLALSIVPVGTAVFLLGFVTGDSPCVMCWEQRTGMALVALIGLFILRYGPRPKYLGLGVLVAAWGIHMGLRHTGMHAARDVGQGFSLEILGAHTYTWSLFIFWVSVVTMGVLLLVVREGDLPRAPRALRPLEKVAMAIFLVVIGGNIIQAFASTGPPPFMGQGDPVRFSFNPRHWIWSLEEYSTAPVTLRGRWAIEKPAVSAATADPAAGPLANLPVLPAIGRQSLALPLRGTVTDLAYDAATDRFLLTTQHGVYITDASLARVVRFTVVDPGFSVDLGPFAGAAFLDSQTVMALSENKSYVVLRENDRADAGRNDRYFLESFDRFDQVRRSRFGTVRARMMYAMSLAFDPATKSIYTVTVPNSKVRQLVVSRFDRRDWTLSEEFLPVLAPDAGLAFRGEKRSLDELYVTGATIADGRMYVISAAHGTLLTIDLRARAVVGAHTIGGVSRPTGIAVKGDALYVVGENGTIVIVEKPGLAAGL